MSRHRGRSDIANDSRAAVEVAGTRGRAGKSNSDHFWTPRRGKNPDGPWRPGKTRHERGSRRG